MTDNIDHLRRRLFGAAALTAAAVQLGIVRSAAAQSSSAGTAPLPAIRPGTHSSFGPLKQIDAGL